MINKLPNKSDKYSQGVFIPTNKHKLIKVNKYGGVMYRSSLEKKVMIYMDLCDDVIHWGAENIEIPYLLTEKDQFGVIVKSSPHRYFPDIYYELKMDDGSVRRIVMEIKPAKQCKPPKIAKKLSKSYKWEIEEWNRNMCKWEFAIQYCNKKGFEFKIFTEETASKMFAISKSN